MPKKLIDLQFPLGGLDRKWAYQTVPPFTSPDMLNVVARDTIKGRSRGGSRPGLGKFSYDLLGSGNPVRMLEQLSVVKSDGLTFWGDTFEGSTLGSVWTAATWLSGAPALQTDSAYSTTNQNLGCTRSALSNFATSSAYQVELDIVPYQAAHYGTYSIFVRMGSGLDVTQDGVACRLTLTGTGSYSFQMTSYSGGTATAYTAVTDSSSTVARAGKFRVLVNGSSISAYWLGTTLDTQTPTLGGSAGHRFGFGLNATVAGGVCLVDSFRIQYYANDNRRVTRPFIVASSNGVLYTDGRLGSFSSVSSNLTLSNDRSIKGQEHLQKLYIADYGDVLSGTDGTAGSSGTKFDATGVSDWTATTPTLNVYDYAITLSNVTGGLIAGQYAITGIASGELTLGATCNTGAGTATWRITRSPKVYDPATAALTRWYASTAGTIPTNQPLTCLYRDRIVLAGGDDGPHLWYMSRQGVPTDWDYAATDSQRAVSGGNSDAGRIAEPITALMPHGDDYLVFGAINSMWVLRGDPAFGGSIDNLSKTHGCVGARAWCRGPMGELYYLGTDGLYVLPPGGSTAPQPLSRAKLPAELRFIDRTTFTVCMAYDAPDRRVHVYVTGEDARDVRHWLYDLDNGGFFPVKLGSATYEPLSILEHRSLSAEDSCVILGCRDGYLRRYKDTYETDDGTTINSYAIIGPLAVGGSPYNEGWISELSASTGLRSGPVAWSILSADNHEGISLATARSDATGYWSAGRNRSVHPRVRGSSIALKLAYYTANRAWTIESIQAAVNRGGKLRIP